MTYEHLLISPSGNWSLQKLLRRFIRHDRIHKKLGFQDLGLENGLRQLILTKEAYLISKTAAGI